jgi:hypothetical protein
MVGDLLPAGKDRVPLQSADLLCWYEQRRDSKSWTEREAARMAVLAKRRGYRNEYTREQMEDFSARAIAHFVPSKS